jgi:hypothetical protein
MAAFAGEENKKVKGPIPDREVLPAAEPVHSVANCTP